MITLDELIAYTVRHATLDYPGTPYFLYYAVRYEPSGQLQIPHAPLNQTVHPLQNEAAARQIADMWTERYGYPHSVLITHDGRVIWDDVFGSLNDTHGRYPRPVGG